MRPLREFWAKYKPYIIVLAILLVIGWIALREVHISNQTKKYVRLEMRFDEIEKSRDKYKVHLDELKNDYSIIEKEKDSIQLELEEKKKELYVLQVKHQKEIDSLLSVETPIDTVYIRTGYLFPNYDKGELVFPYSGSQVRQIYSVAIRFPRLQSEYELQTKTLNTCYTLNDAFEKESGNLKSQIGVMNKDVAAADKQILIQNSQIKTLEKSINRKRAWNFVYKSLAVSGWTFFMLK